MTEAVQNHHIPVGIRACVDSFLDTKKGIGTGMRVACVLLRSMEGLAQSSLPSLDTASGAQRHAGADLGR